MGNDEKLQGSLELRVGRLYSRLDLREKGLKMMRFYKERILFTGSNGTGYYFIPKLSKRKGFKLKYQKSFTLPEITNYTAYDNEEYEDALRTS